QPAGGGRPGDRRRGAALPRGRHLLIEGLAAPRAEAPALPAAAPAHRWPRAVCFAAVTAAALLAALAAGAPRPSAGAVARGARAGVGAEWGGGRGRRVESWRCRRVAARAPSWWPGGGWPRRAAGDGWRCRPAPGTPCGCA